MEENRRFFLFSFSRYSARSSLLLSRLTVVGWVLPDRFSFLSLSRLTTHDAFSPTYFRFQRKFSGGARPEKERSQFSKATGIPRRNATRETREKEGGGRANGEKIFASWSKEGRWKLSSLSQTENLTINSWLVSNDRVPIKIAMN